jgi:adenine-specific DNA-methyltransferase
LVIWEEMKAKSFMSYNIAIQKQEEHLEDFKQLAFEEQQKVLITLLDKNQLYVNLSSLHDKDFACSAEEVKVTEDFYQLKK